MTNHTQKLLLILALTLVFVNAVSQSFDSVNINNINARINAGGNLFQVQSTGSPAFEVPKGSGKHTVFSAELWIGGLGNGSILHEAGQQYGGIIGDTTFWPGPVMDTPSYSVSENLLWNRVWKVNKSEIDSHIVNWSESGYVIPQNLVDWPGNGDVGKGQAALLAPFVDRTGDQIYDPSDGDYPLIKGDQVIYFLYNDDRKAHLNGGEKLRIEIHGMAYEFDCPSDSALHNTIFVNYRIVNRSANNYDSTYIGANFDGDIGDPNDDYVESDVARGAFFQYNADSIDGIGAPSHYGANPPAQSIVFLKGPRMPNDGLDNPSGGCDESINGFGFGDGITDNECYGMMHFKYYCNPSCLISAQNDPYTADDYYNYLRGKWKDGKELSYGGFGHFSNCTSCESARFMYSSNSDTCHWGTGGIAPLDTIAWTEENAGLPPADKRGLGSMGPFTFGVGDTVELDFAFVFGRDYADTTGDPYTSVIVMKSRIDSIRSYFEKNMTPCGDAFTGIGEVKEEVKKIRVYPNPVTDYLEIECDRRSKIEDFSVFNMMGQKLISFKNRAILPASSKTVIAVNHLNKGIHVIMLKVDGEILYRKFLKL